MKKNGTYCWLLLVMVGIATPVHCFLRGRSFFSPRSQSTHAEREIVGWEEEINLFNADEVCYGSFSIMPLYSRSFNASELAGYLFGCDTLTFSGSQVPDRGDNDILADYFALPIDFVSTVCLKPIIQNAILDFNLYIGLDLLYPGIYLRVHLPFVHTVWNLNMCETIENPGVQSYPAGYMASGVIPRNQMMPNVLAWFSNCAIVGDIYPLEYGKIFGSASHNGLSDVQVVFGWNMINEPDYHFGLTLRTAIPTGNHSHSFLFFEPIVGNGGHWELGLGLTGHTFLWDNPTGVHSFSIYGDLNLTHLFNARERRSFDFKENGAGSRYILIEEIGNPVVKGLKLNDELNMTPTPPQFALQQYHSKVMPAINKTTLDCDVNVAAQVDAVIKLVYAHCSSFSFDVGYNFWARTSERISCRQCFPSDCFAVKGDAQLYGFAEDNPTGFIGLNATQHQATMLSGQKNSKGELNDDFTNKNADNAALASFEFDPPTDIDLTQMFGIPQPVAGSKQAMLLTDCDIDTLSAASPAALSNSFFAHLKYAWEDTDVITPFIGVGGEITLDASGSKRNNALSEWAVWIKGGVSY